MLAQENAVAMTSFKHLANIDTQLIQKELQMSEFYGKMKVDHSYYSEEYKSLLLYLRENDSEWTQSGLESKVALAKNGVDQCREFIQEDL